MQRTITFLVQFVTIIVIIVGYCPCYYAEDPPLNRSVARYISVDAEKRNESFTVPLQKAGKRNESLTLPSQNTVKKDDSLTATSQNTGKNNESLAKPPQSTEKNNNDSLTAPSRNTGTNNESSVMPAQNGTVDKFECRRQPCVRKCCADGQVFRYRINIMDIECVVPFDNETYSFADRLKRLLILSPETNESSSSSFVGIEYGKTCRGGNDFLNYPNDTFTLLNGGSQLDFQTDTVNGSTADFCMEFITNENRLVPLLCPITVIEHHQVHPLYPITLSISALFMMATGFVYYLIGNLKTLYGKVLFCHVTSLTIGYLFLIPTQIFHFYETCKPFCFVAAIGVQFFILAGFFWLSVISFDLWRSFSFKRLQNPWCKRNNRKQFIRYSAYAWGCPILITSVTLLAEFWPKMSEVFPYPNLAVNTCGFGDKLSASYYFYGPMGIVLMINVIIFCAVFSGYIQRSKSLSRTFSNDSENNRQSPSEQSRFAVCLKFSIVMGACWIMEVVSALAGGPEQIWYATDICNSMQGVAIFFITICSNQPRRLLRQKFSMISLKSSRSSSRQTTVSDLNVT